MTTTTAPRGRHARPDDAAPTPRPSLLRAELLRLRSRRLLRVLLVLVVLGWLAGTVISVFAYAKTTPAQLDEARQQIAQIVADSNGYRVQCLADPPDGDTSLCPPVSTTADFRPTDFVAKDPFELRRAGLDGALVTAVGLAVVAVVAGATWIGGEWSSRSMVGLLFWEPRRWRVHLVKAAVITVAGATLGLAFVYFAVAETAVRAIWDTAQAGLLTTNAIALVTRGGYTCYTYVETSDSTGMYSSTATEHHVSNLQGGLVLAGVAVGSTALSGLLLARRDVQ